MSPAAAKKPQLCTVCDRGEGRHEYWCSKGQQSLPSVGDEPDRCAAIDGRDRCIHDKGHDGVHAGGGRTWARTAAERKAKSREKKKGEVEALKVRAGFAVLQGQGGQLPVHQTKPIPDGGDPMRWASVPTIEPPKLDEKEAPLGPDGKPVEQPAGPQSVVGAAKREPTAAEKADAAELSGMLLVLWRFAGAAAGELAKSFIEDPKVNPMLKMLAGQAIEHWNNEKLTARIDAAGQEFAIKYQLTGMAVKPPCEVVVGGVVLVSGGVFALAAIRKKQEAKRGRDPQRDAIDVTPEEQPPDAASENDNRPPDWSAFGNVPQGAS